MNEIAWRAAKVGVALTLAAVVAAFFSRGLGRIFLDAYLLALGGVLLLALVRTTRLQTGLTPSPFDQALATMRRRPADTGPLALARDLDLGTLTAFHLHVRVRPLLREIASHRLLRRYGVDLDREPARARELLGAKTWELVQPHRSPPRDRLAAGPRLAELSAVADELERV